METHTAQSPRVGETGRGQYYLPGLSFIPNTDTTVHTDHTHGDPTMCKLWVSYYYYFFENGTPSCYRQVCWAKLRARTRRGRNSEQHEAPTQSLGRRKAE